MKKQIKFLIASLIGVITMSAGAHAQGLFEPADGNWYVSGFVGAAFPDDIDGNEIDDSFYFGGAVGARLPFKSFGFLQTRLELEVSDFQVVNFGFGPNTDALFVLANSYGELRWSDDQAIIPYFGGGLGIGRLSADVGEIEISATNFATSTALGVTIPVWRIELYGEGRYFRIYGGDDFGGVDPDGFTLTAGARFKF